MILAFHCQQHGTDPGMSEHARIQEVSELTPIVPDPPLYRYPADEISNLTPRVLYTYPFWQIEAKQVSLDQSCHRHSSRHSVGANTSIRNGYDLGNG